MRRITLWMLSTGSALALLFSYRTSTMGRATAGSRLTSGPRVVSSDPGSDTGPGANAQPTTSAATGPTATTTAGTRRTTPTTTRPSPAPPTASTAARASTVVDGAGVDTRWGVVQVRVTIASGRLTDVVTLQQPDSNSRDARINGFALPRLRQEAISAQSGKIDVVSGATVTSQGYIGSLQSALDAAGFRG